MKFDPDSYSLMIRKEDVDGEYLYVGRVAELPNVRAYEETFEEAKEILIDAITSLYEIASDTGRSFPAPRQEEVEYSGRVTLRLTKSLHRQAAAQAETEGVSLNQYLATAIAQHAAQADMFCAMTGVNRMPSATSSEAKVLKFPNMGVLREAVTTEVTNGGSK